ncbi:phosphatidate cytidylyltransferase [Brevibacillus laterosporus]|uniref:phosphatidate cytidylyltransferase n=1 Tax=Brevibacillus laterosporus TaxID=1465 RepID=UPI0014447A74|nr:phosphatidate cytidylyltransferase [Brevibacillus laterosporus]NKQ20040.1 phosphatidate cytidylyltransferase [Brevibacillus laterosporus]WNX29885.1 phosphatidate cytidylyltransferase [Brevibacillus laterosporus]
MKERIITGLLGGVGFLTLVYLGGIWYSSLVLLMAFIGLFEFLRMANIKPFSFPGILGYVILISAWQPDLTALFFPVLGFLKVSGFGAITVEWSQILLLPLFLLLFYTVLSKNRFHIEHAALVLLGALYIGYGFHYVAVARGGVGLAGFWLTIIILLSVWSTDSGAYFAGKALGKRKLWPDISPNKTVEGALGGFLASLVVVGVIDALLIFLQVPGALPWGQALAIAAITGIVGPLGDLVESAYKRHFAVKDSGHILPGHGGILDRFDSMLIVFPLLYLFGLF